MLGDISTGASSVIQRATSIARKMVGTYGMSAKMGNVAFDAGSDEVFIGKSMGHTRPYSEKTAAEMDGEIRAIIDGAYEKAQEILTAYRSQLTAISEYLLANDALYCRFCSARFSLYCRFCSARFSLYCRTLSSNSLSLFLWFSSWSHWL